jgi:hypothetical protein
MDDERCNYGSDGVLLVGQKKYALYSTAQIPAQGEKRGDRQIIYHPMLSHHLGHH